MKMPKRHCLSGFAVLLVVWANLFGLNRAAADPSDWAKNSDVICIASCTAIHDTNQVWYGDKDIAYKVRIATFQMAQIRVGPTVSRDISVTLHDLDHQALWKKGITTYSVPLFFSEFRPGHVYLLLLKSTPDGTYVLTGPYFGSQSAVELIGVPAVDKSLPVLSWLIKAVTPSLASPDVATQRGALDFLSGFGAIAGQNLTETIPAILPLIHSADEETRVTALVTLASLQDPDVIPNLADIADGKGSHAAVAAYALRWYHSASAAPFLLRLLHGRSLAVRRAASYSLRLSLDPKSVPLLSLRSRR